MNIAESLKKAGEREIIGTTPGSRIWLSTTLPEGQGCGLTLDLPFIPFSLFYLNVRFETGLINVHVSLKVT